MSPKPVMEVISGCRSGERGHSVIPPEITSIVPGEVFNHSPGTCAHIDVVADAEWHPDGRVKDVRLIETR